VTNFGVKGVLWRRVLQATIDTLTDDSKGQFHIALTTNKLIPTFFEGLPQQEPTAHGGYELEVPIAAFDGPNPVPAQSLTVRFMGPGSARKDWNIPSQRSDTAYPLWRPGRAFPAGQPPTPGTDTIILVRDQHDRFHARWLNAAAVAALPQPLRDIITKDEAGVWSNPGGKMPPTSRAVQVYLALLRHRNVLLYGPPGTGKTHLLRDVQALFEGDLTWVNSQEERHAIQATATQPTRIAFVTFHQSFGYEDFVVGLRPDPDATDKLLALKPTPGVLLEMSEYARVNGQRSLLLIDEINRGNASRIFGEFITLLDIDKRLADDGSAGPQTVKLRLPYQLPARPISVDLDGTPVDVPAPFTMPSRVFVLATMNSVDKSIAPLDAALRRRFHIERLGPELDVISTELGIDTPPDPLTLSAVITDPLDVARLAVALLRSLNEGVAAFLGPDFQLGHWFLRPLADASDLAEMEDGLIELWLNRLLPQLEDYFQGRSDQLRALLRSPRSDDPVSWRSPRSEIEEVGAVAVLERRTVDRGVMIEFLRRISGVQTTPTTPTTPAAPTTPTTP
jgi:5-methylcytosine-specific restriction protein B